MSEINQLSPALSLTLLDLDTNSYHSLYLKMLRVTLFELLFKKVLVAVPGVVGKGRKARPMTHIGRGPHFQSYPYKQHEVRFRDSTPAHLIPLNQLAYAVRMQGTGVFKKSVHNQLMERGLLRVEYRKQFIFTKTTWHLTEKGYHTRRELEYLLSVGEQLAANRSRIPPETIRRYIRDIGPNIVLLTAFSPFLLQEWRQAIQSEYNSDGGYSSGGSDSYDYSFDSIFIFGDDSIFSDGFEGAFDYGSDSDSWGDSSDSGDGGSGGDSGGDGGGDGGGSD